jgi:hypothetical protein
VTARSPDSPRRADVRTLAEKRAARIAATERMLRPMARQTTSVHQMAIAARRQLHAAGPPPRPHSVVLDASLLTRPEPGVEVPWAQSKKGVDRAGPVPGLRAVGGTRTPALQVFLLALLEAQCRQRRRSNGQTAIPVDPGDGEPEGPTWTKLVAVPPTDSGELRRGAYQRENRLRQIKRALDRLAQLGRVELGPAHHSDRYEGFMLAAEHEDGTEREPYRQPPPSRALPIPVELWLNGWIHMLTDAELLLYLALRHQASLFKTEPLDAQRVLSRAIRDNYGISKDTYENLRELELYGLIQRIVDENRSLRDGTMRGFRSHGQGIYHRISLNPDGLSGDAGERILDGLQHLRDVLDA